MLELLPQLAAPALSVHDLQQELVAKLAATSRRAMQELVANFATSRRAMR